MRQEYTTSPHERLAHRLDEAPLGAPRGPELMAILEALFSRAEAELAAEVPVGKPISLGVLAERRGRPAGELAPILEGMADRGLCYQRLTSKGAYYSLLPVVPGMAETQFLGGGTGEDKRHLARLFAAYYRPGLGRSLVEAGAPYSRVIPVGRAVRNSQEILPFEQAENVLRGAGSLALGNCFCRHEAELMGHGCGAPKDVCLIFGPFAEFAVRKGFARAADLNTAMNALERAEMAGLVHVTDNVANGASFMCNCCGCCCMFLKTITQLKAPGAVSQAGWLAVVDQDNCTGCGQCREICQVEAPQAQDEAMAVDPALCLGCGQCALACPTGAIEMQRRQRPRPPAAPPDLMNALASARAEKPTARS